MSSLYIEYHDKERYLLERRLLLLRLLDDILQNDFRSSEEIQSDPEFQKIQSEFQSVLNPKDLRASIKQIYPRRLF